MYETEPSRVSNRLESVEELITEARVEVLNAELAERGISADRIIAVLQVPGQTMANPTTPKFRVLYRAD